MKIERTRRLAAIMFTDIVGYTALMHQSEAAAVEVRATHRRVFQREHDRCHGKILQYYGDGTLSVFQSALECVECAIAIQQQLSSGHPKVPLRIGLHLGDIVFDGVEVYGDGVNMASRIESMGVAGAILLSSATNEELKNHPHISTRSLGRFGLKNIAKPVEVFAVSNEGIKLPLRSELKGKQVALTNSIAVLPFVSIPATGEHDYFSDGITEEIINTLSRVKGLKITSRTSSFFFKNKNLPVSTIGQELNVSTILEGSVRLSGNRMRISAHLINVADGFQFWSETWDRNVDNIFAIQDEISLLIADKLRKNADPTDLQPQRVASQTHSMKAYKHYLKGKHQLRQYNPETVLQAILHFEKALTFDAHHVESYIGLSNCYSFLAQLGFLPAKQTFSKAKDYIQRALQLNDQHPDVYVGLASVLFWSDWDFEKAHFNITKALQLNPNLVEGHHLCALILFLTGNIAAAIEHIDEAIRLDPLSPHPLFTKIWIYYMLEDVETALHLLEIAKQKSPDFLFFHVINGLLLLLNHQYDEAIRYFEDHTSVDATSKYGMLALAYAKKQEEHNTEKFLTSLQGELQNNHAPRARAFILMVYTVSGKTEEALTWIEEGVAAKFPLMLLTIPDPVIKTLRDEPRYQAVVKKIFGASFNGEISIGSASPGKMQPPEDALEGVVPKLLVYFEEDRPYLNPHLTVHQLAEQLEIQPSQLSWILNEQLGRSFDEFMAHYRVEAFKTKLMSSNNKSTNFTQMAIECGFASSSDLYEAFEKEMAMPLAEYVVQLSGN